MMFRKKTQTAIGVDISDLNLKAVQVIQSGKKIKIQALSRVDLPKNIIERGLIKDKQVAAAALSNMLNKPMFGSFTTNQTIVSLPETRTFIKLINIEKGPNKLENIIDSEIEKYIPFSASEVYYDWQIINEEVDNYSILIGAAPKSIVEQYIDLIQSCKLEVSAFEIEAMPICRSLLAEESMRFNGDHNTTYGIIDIGAKRTSLTIYSQKSIIFTLSMPISGEEITEKISSTLEINRDQAEKAKLICGLDKDNARGIIHDILSDMIQDLTSRVNDAVEYYSKNYPSLPPVKKIIVCGGGANVKSLDKILSEEIKIEVVKGNPFINMDEKEDEFGKNLIETHNLKDKKITNIKDKLSITQSSGISYATAIGLSLRKIFIKK